MIKEILHNLYRIEVPIPNNPLKALNCFVVKSRDRNLVIDTGMNRPECWEVLQVAFGELNLKLEDTDFFITHLHADHSGLITRFKTSSSRAYCSLADSNSINLGKITEHWQAMGDFLGQNGFPLGELEEAIEKHPGYRYCTQVPVDFTIVGQDFPMDIGDYHFKCQETPGHTKGHLCLYEPEKRIFIAGDHLLKDITPNISLFSHNDNPLQEYLASLEKTALLDIELVLPGHRSLFGQHRQRIEELKLHHRDRAQEVLEILRNGPLNGYQIAALMTWDMTYKSWDEFPVQQRWFATGEGLAHIRYLEGQGLLEKELKNGIYLYYLVSRNVCSNGEYKSERVKE